MSLLTQAMEDVVLMEKKREPDGEGGFTTDWAEGVSFKAAISFDSSMEARTAESFGGYSYTKATDANGAPIGWHKAFASRLNEWRKL